MSSRSVTFFRSLPSLIETNPKKVFWYFVGLHFFSWTIFSTISSPNAPLDVIEGYAWGREWLWGTYKHPPMQAWVLEILGRLTFKASWSHFLASQVCITAAFWAVWQTGRRILDDTQALIGVLLLEGAIYYNFTSTEFNPNVLQIAFWALAVWSFYRGVKDNRTFDWVLLGLWSAGGMYSKYSTILLIGTFAVLTITRPEARRRLKSHGPYLAFGVGVILFLPHLVWLWNNNFLPFEYMMDRMTDEGPATKFVTPPEFFPTFLLSPIVFVVAQLLALLPATILLLDLDGAKEKQKPSKSCKFAQPFLAAVTFAPMIITLLASAIFHFKVHDMWGAPFFNFAGLWAVTKFYPRGAVAGMRFVAVWSLLFLAGLLSSAGTNLLSPYIANKNARIHFPGKSLAKIITHNWHEKYNVPLSYVIGNTWEAGNVAFYSKDRPHLFINANTTISTWINTDDLRQKGGVIIWCQRPRAYCTKEIPDDIAKLFPEAITQNAIEMPYQTEANVPLLVMGWAIIPPKMSAMTDLP